MKVGDKVIVVKIRPNNGRPQEVNNNMLGRVFELQQVFDFSYIPYFNGEWSFYEDELELIKTKKEKIRTFDSGATRDTDKGKLDYEAALSPIVLERYLQYLQKHTVQSDGNIRPFDNWQRGIPRVEYIKSKWRHFMVWWLIHRGCVKDENDLLEDSICADLFNTMGYLYELLKEKGCIKIEKKD